jgi:hypothetical protein
MKRNALLRLARTMQGIDPMDAMREWNGRKALESQ